MNKGKIIIAMIFMILIGNPSMAAAEEKISWPDTVDMIDTYVQQEMEASKIPGLAIGIVHGNEIIYTRGYGMADEQTVRVTQNTPFYIGSVGKTFTALAIRQLEGEGKIDVKAPAVHYIPWFTLADGSGKDITVEELLNHTSGLTTRAGNAAYSYNKKYSIEQAVRQINKREKLKRPAGESYEYSNLNYVILGLIVEYASGLTYEEYITKNIFEPLQMKESFVSKAKAANAGLAQGYREIYGLNIPIYLDQPIGQIPAGFQLSSANDMAKYLVSFLNNGYYEGKSILPNNQLLPPEDPLLPSYSTASYYGLEWGITSDPALKEYNRFYGFMGATPDFNSAILISQVHRYGVVVLVNQRGTFRTPVLTAQLVGNGITDILLYHHMPSSVPRKKDTKQLLLPGITFLISLVCIYSCVRFPSKLNTAKRKRAILFLVLLNILLPVVFLIGVPILYDNSWIFFLSAGAEYNLWEFALSLLLLVLGGIKLSFIAGEKMNKDTDRNDQNV